MQCDVCDIATKSAMNREPWGHPITKMLIRAPKNKAHKRTELVNLKRLHLNRAGRELVETNTTVLVSTIHKHFIVRENNSDKEYNNAGADFLF